ncbi:MAG: hypothetical protein ACI8PZ_002836 [Myxococcota bacterium]|jgi:hypothetical protein
MKRVVVFLRTSLFSFGGADAHVPPGVMVVEGNIVDRVAGGVVLDTDRFLDERGRELSAAGLKVQLPWAKIDHILENGS